MEEQKSETEIVRGMFRLKRNTQGAWTKAFPAQWLEKLQMTDDERKRGEMFIRVSYVRPGVIELERISIDAKVDS